jgi:hypothetical protein
MPHHAIRAILAATVAAATLICSVAGASAACAPCGCIPITGCPVASLALRVEQGPPDYDAMLAAQESLPGSRRYPYIRTWYGYPHWWTTRIVAAGPSMVRYRPNRRCYLCDVAVSR